MGKEVEIMSIWPVCDGKALRLGLSCTTETRVLLVTTTHIRTVPTLCTSLLGRRVGLNVTLLLLELSVSFEPNRSRDPRVSDVRS